MERIFDDARFAAGAGASALDWSGIDILEPKEPCRGSGWLRAPLSMFCIVVSGLLSQGFISQCL